MRTAAQMAVRLWYLLERKRAIDHRPDVVVNNFNERPYLYRNRFPERHWAAFQLRGTKSNRDAVGARVRLTVAGKTLTRLVGSGSGLGATFGF